MEGLAEAASSHRQPRLDERAQGWREAEQAVDRISGVLGRSAGMSCTAAIPLLTSPPHWSRLTPPPISRLDVEGICGEEWPEHLDDVMFRRTSWHFYHGYDEDAVQAVAGWMARALGWPAGRREEELLRYKQIVRQDGVPIS